MSDGRTATQPLRMEVRRNTPRMQQLSNGRLTSFVSEAGGGGTTWGELAVTRWAPDTTRDAEGQWLYLRDRDSGAFWSASAQPVAHSWTRATASFRDGVVE